MNTSTTAAANLRGIIGMLVSQACFVLNDMFVKLAANEAGLPATQIMALRAAIAAVGIGGLLYAMNLHRELPRVITSVVLARNGVEALMALTFITALAHLPLGDITTILQVAPLCLTVLSVVILREHVGWRRWAAVIVGFIGVVLVVQPTGEGFNAYALLVLFVALLVAIRDLLTRYLPDDLPSLLVTFATTIAVGLLGLLGGLVQAWKPIPAEALFYLIGAAAFITGANFFIVFAFRGVEISVVSPFRYAVVVWAMILGFAVWGDIPNELSFVGAGIIIASGLYTLHREALSRRAGRR
ncbi:MAG: DMT family transporter [Alphaproteobacteria bacterium]|nr:DMT family transporter [Alphaproteobacteria bacterium]